MGKMRKKGKYWGRESEDFSLKWGPNEDQFSSLVLMRTKSSIEDLYGSTEQYVACDLHGLQTISELDNFYHLHLLRLLHLQLSIFITTFYLCSPG